MKNKDKVLRAIRDYNMFPRGASVVCGVSGGADSVSLVCILRELKELDLKLYAVHVNHCLRGAESDGDEEYVRTLCADIGVPLYAERIEVAKIAAERGLGTEECARELRYQAFTNAARKFDAEFIATAHNANDNLETAVFNLCRGSGVTGLAGVPPKRRLGQYTVVRPLIYCSRAEIEEYLTQRGIKYVVDSTNLTNDYTRNKIRHEILPKLELINPELYETASNSQRLMRAEAAFIEGEALKAYRRLGGGSVCSAAELMVLDKALFGKTSALFYKDAGGTADLTSANIESIKNAAGSLKPSAVAELPGGIVAVRYYDKLVFKRREAEKKLAERELIPGEILELPEAGMVFYLENAERPDKFNIFNEFYLDSDKINGKLKIRGRMTGDRLSLAGHSGGKTLKKLMIDLKIPREKRDTTPVICDSLGAAAVPGIGVDSRVKIDNATKNIIKITFNYTEDR